MANDVKIRFRSYLPGGGFDASGGAKQGKTRVVGEIDVTAYQGQGGEPLSAIDIGLNVIDSISLRVADEASGDNVTADMRAVVYTKSTGHFYLFKTEDDGAKGQVAKLATETLEFDALGDSAADVELT
jgi:hypothetical protein